MLFMLVSRAKPGTKREELVERFSQQLHPETWDLIRHGDTMDKAPTGKRQFVGAPDRIVALS
jgi:hypothetical protein